MTDAENQMPPAWTTPASEEHPTTRFLLPGLRDDELEDLRVDTRGKLAFLADAGGSLLHARHLPFMIETFEQRVNLVEAELLWRGFQETVVAAPPGWYPADLDPQFVAEIGQLMPLDTLLEEHAGFGEGMFRPVLLALYAPCPLVEHPLDQARFFLRPDTGAWACVDCERAGDVIALAHHLLGLEGDALLDVVLQEAGLPPRGET